MDSGWKWVGGEGWNTNFEKSRLPTDSTAVMVSISVIRFCDYFTCIHMMVSHDGIT